MLSDKEIDFIHDWLLDSGITYESLQADLLDHTACIVENEMESGKTFQEAWQNILITFTSTELKNTQESTLYLLTKKSKTMKKTSGITGIIASFLIIMGTVFKVLHFPGASIMLVLGLLLTALVVLPIMASLSFQKNDSSIQKLTNWSIYVAGILITLGALFKIQHWPGAAILSGLGFATTCLIFVPLYIFKSYKITENRIFAMSQALLIFAVAVLLWGLVDSRF